MISVRSEVQVFPGPPAFARVSEAKAAAPKPKGEGGLRGARAPARQASRPPASGAIAQLGERLLCKQEVVGSIPSGSTSLRSLCELRLGRAGRERRLPRRSSKSEAGYATGATTIVREATTVSHASLLDEVACVISDIVKRRSIRVFWIARGIERCNSLFGKRYLQIVGRDPSQDGA